MKPLAVLLTGASGSGKTTLCAHLAARFKAQGMDVAGLLTRPRVVGGEKIGMDVQDVRTGERRALAERVGLTRGPATQDWHFHANSLAWGTQVLRGTVPCEILIVDELGPLELVRAEGWTVGLDVIRQQRFDLALVTVRPILARPLQAQLDQVLVMSLPVTRPRHTELLAQLTALAAEKR